MLTLDVLPRFLQKIPVCCMDFCWLTITSYLCPDMRSVVLLCGMLSMIFGQAPSLAWVELADTVYRIENAQDTFVYIQSRSGNVRRFDRYDTTGGSLFLAVYDIVCIWMGVAGSSSSVAMSGTILMLPSALVRSGGLVIWVLPL